LTAFARSPTIKFVPMRNGLSSHRFEMQRRFLLRLCKELAPGTFLCAVFLLAFLDQKRSPHHSAIAKKMGHTTRRQRIW